MSARWGPRVAEFCIKPVAGRTSDNPGGLGRSRESGAKFFSRLSRRRSSSVEHDDAGRVSVGSRVRFFITAEPAVTAPQILRRFPVFDVAKPHDMGAGARAAFQILDCSTVKGCSCATPRARQHRGPVFPRGRRGGVRRATPSKAGIFGAGGGAEPCVDRV